MLKVMLAAMFASMILLTGCKIGGGGGGGSGSGTSSPAESLQGSTLVYENGETNGLNNESFDETPVEQSGSTAVIPEPATIAIFSLGLAGLAAGLLRRKAK